ncbi:hypothetical protein [Piscinibacter sp.]|uniref:hypothetical protein n=1 Tax=Piscinibacter sp. TaxID=1903157 RepID=UPI0039E427E9
MRTPAAIAAELAAMRDKAAASFLPPDVRRALDLAAEFAVSVAAVLRAAGLAAEGQG